jgi:pimeloyl-ACP methyl ester carboxylesterase
VGDSSGNKPVVFMQHGLFDSAYCWMMNYADVAPAFVAARAGYDVWLGNSRGNTFSEANVNLDPYWDESKFWDFDWQDMGTKDLPAVFDFITGTTGQQKLAYVGHSQGTTELYYGLAEMQSYFANKLSVAVMLGPVSKIPNT